ncbi:MAG: CAP domain-containing protein [Chitinophagales bacterium]
MKTITRLFSLLLVVFSISTTNALKAQDVGLSVEPPTTYSGSAIQTNSTSCPSGIENLSAQNLSFEQEVVVLVNELRQDLGLAPLKVSPTLTKAARYHAKNMAENNYFSHTSEDSNGSEICAPFSRIGAFYDWIAAAENIAAGYNSPESVVEGWINSPGHYANLISPYVYEVGVGYWYQEGGSYGGVRWVQDFGRRYNVYPLIINNEETETENADVDLFLYGGELFTEMRFRAEDGEWNEWESFNANTGFNFNATSSGDMLRVHAEMRNNSGFTVTAEDDIAMTGVNTANGVTVKLNVILSGAYNTVTEEMRTTLRQNNLIPVEQPFNRSPWNYEGTENTITLANMPNNVVDWILLEARDAANNFNVIEQKAALLLNDGTVVDASGTVNGAVQFSSLTANTDYYISVKSRNHLGVLSATSINVPNATAFDFTKTTNVLDGQTQLYNIEDELYGLPAGDFDSNGIITVVDYNFFKTEVSIIGEYVDGDCNLDRSVTVTDFNNYRPNISRIGVSQIRYQ